MRRFILIVTVLVALLLGVATASARCADVGDDCRAAKPTATWLPRWTATPTATATATATPGKPQDNSGVGVIEVTAVLVWPKTATPEGYPGYP